MNLILPGSRYALYGSRSLQLEGSHDFQGLAVLDDLSQPVAALHLITHFGKGSEVPQTFVVQRLGILASPEEYALHLVQVVLESVIVLAQHAGAQLDFQHVAGELGLGTDLQSARALENLHVHVLPQHLDDLCHQAVAARLNVANLALAHGSIHPERHHVGNYATYSSFCHFLL